MGHPVGVFLSQFFFLCRLIALSGFLLQILSFIPIIYARATTVFLMLFIAFHLIVDMTFYSHFDRHFMVLVFLFPWGDILPSLEGRFKGQFWSAAFSLTTMYAWIDKEPLKRKVIFVQDKDNKKRRIKRSEIWPLANTKMFSKFKALEKQKNGKETINLILEKMKTQQSVFNDGVHSLKRIKKISLEHCFWKTTKDYIQRPKKPDFCEIFVEKKF